MSKQREIWNVIIHSSKVKKYKTVPDEVKSFETNTTVIGSTQEEVLSLPSSPVKRIEGEIKSIEFLKLVSKTLYKS